MAKPKKVPAKFAADNRPAFLNAIDEGLSPGRGHPVNNRLRKASTPPSKSQQMLNIRLRDSEATDRAMGRFEPHDMRFRSAPTPTPRGKR
jgi:hypothetical protein